MGLVGIDNLSDGMLLARDIHDRQGRLLLTEGTELTRRHIRMFMTWGISQVDIRDSDAQADQPVDTENVDPALLQQTEKSLAKLFSHNDLSHPAIAELFRLCLIRKLRNGH